MTDHALSPAPVVIVGDGPVGLSTALGLAHGGVASVVVGRGDGERAGSRAFAVWGRTLEALAPWGVGGEILRAADARERLAPVDTATGRPIFALGVAPRGGGPMPGLAVVPQAVTERVLGDRVRAEPLVTVVAGECVGIEQTDGAVCVQVRARGGGANTTIRARYAVAADGSRSTVRGLLGLRAPGSQMRLRVAVFDVTLDAGRAERVLISPRHRGLLAALWFAPGRWRVIATVAPGESQRDGAEELTPDVVSAHVWELFGECDYAVTWQSVSRLHQRRMRSFRAGRVLFAGDAAHVVSPSGGQGMNQGIQDAENLAWTLAAVVNGADADRMLDGYAREREGAADSIARRAALNSVLELRTPVWTRPPAFAAARLALAVPSVAERVADRLTMRDLRYRASWSSRLGGDGVTRRGPAGWASAWGVRRAVGRRMPDARVGDRWLSETMHGGAAVVAIGVPPPRVPEGVRAVRLWRAPRGSGLRAGDVAVVRPDRHIGAVLRGPTVAAVARSLRDHVGQVNRRTLG